MILFLHISQRKFFPKYFKNKYGKIHAYYSESTIAKYPKNQKKNYAPKWLFSNFGIQFISHGSTTQTSSLNPQSRPVTVAEVTNLISSPTPKSGTITTGLRLLNSINFHTNKTPRNSIRRLILNSNCSREMLRFP